MTDDELLLEAYREVKKLLYVWDIDEFAVIDLATVLHNDGSPSKMEREIIGFLEKTYDRNESPRKIIKDAIAKGLVPQPQTTSKEKQNDGYDAGVLLLD